VRFSLLAVAALGALVLSQSGAAKTIVGTNGNDTLRGTAKADRLYGKRGSDRLYGLGGNDLLVPGPGRDIVSCGSGRDTVYADARDVVRRDCEVVRRSPPPPPPPPATAGHYVGLSSQNEQVTFDVLATGPVATNFRINSVNQSCQPPDLVSTFGALDFSSAQAQVAADGAFAFSYRGPGTVMGPGAVSGNAANFDITVNGRLTGTEASGTARFDMTFMYADINFTCTSGVVTWTASRA
jgi:hypothetical protein